MDTSGRQHETRGTRSRAARTERWALVLAGGDGTRLRGLTRGMAGDDRPKQFCSTDFSRRVLGESPAQLAGLPVRGVEWSDLGSPDRVLALRRRTAVPWDELAAGSALVVGVAS
jgi:hypothetical protein